jgi:hypothetical protein
LPEIRYLGLSSPSAKRDAYRAGTFGGELEPPRCRHREFAYLGDDGAKAAVPQASLSTGRCGTPGITQKLNKDLRTIRATLFAGS